MTEKVQKSSSSDNVHHRQTPLELKQFVMQREGSLPPVEAGATGLILSKECGGTG
jgi:hypothetical protein